MSHAAPRSACATIQPGATTLLRRAWLPYALALVVIGLAYWNSPNFDRDGARTTPYAGDFLQEYVGGAIVAAGESDRLYDREFYLARQQPYLGERVYFPMVYPPFYYAAVSPLSRLSVHAAAAIWAVLMVAALLAALVVMQRVGVKQPAAASNAKRVDGIAGKTAAAAVAVWLPLAAVFFTPVIESLTSSQKGTLCLLLLAATHALSRSGRPLIAGAVFGLLAFKPQLVLVIAAVMFCKRQWRFCAGGLVTGVVLVLASLAVSPQACGDYFRLATGADGYMENAGYDLHKSHTLAGLAKAAAILFPDVSVWVLWLPLAGAAVGLLAICLRSEFQPTEGPRFDVQFSALVVATVLLSPHLFTYDLTILLLPMFLLLQRLLLGLDAPPGRRSRGADKGALARDRRLAALLTLLFAAPAISVSWADTIGVQVYTLLLVWLLAELAGDLWTERGSLDTPRHVTARDWAGAE